MQADYDYSKVILIKNRYNSGVIVSNYNKSIFERLYLLVKENIYKLTSDEENLFVSDQYIFELLNNIDHFNIKQLDLSYNIHPILVESALKNRLIRKPIIIHFMVNPKPWDFLNLRAGSYKFENY